MAAVGRAFEINEDERNLCLLPIYHVFGLVQNILLGLNSGTCTGIVKNLSPADIIPILGRFQPTMISAVPLQLRYLQSLLPLSNSSDAINHIRTITGGQMRRLATGGAPLDPEIRAGFESLNLGVVEGYGLSETAGAVCMLGDTPEMATDRCPGVELRIDQPDSSGCGEVCVRGPMLFRGYFRDPQSTAQVMDGEWLRTGDMGSLNESGILHLHGRIKELIVTEGGKKAAPAEVEKHYQEIAGIEELAVFARPTARGDRIDAAIVLSRDLAPGDHKVFLDLEVAIQQRAANLPGHLRIERIHLVDELPKTRTGKVRRHQLQARFKSTDDAVKEAPSKGASSAIDLTQRIVEMVVEITGNDRVDAARTFADNGLDSMQAVELALQIESELGKKLTPTAFWTHPTPIRLATFLNGEKESAATSSEPLEEEDAIAVIGLSCRFPGAENPAAFWDLLLNGTDPKAQMSQDRQSMLGCTSDAIAAYLADIDQFDPLFFRISPLEANRMDPQHRLWLELCWEALAHAGIAPGSLAGSDTAVFAGCGPAGYSNLLRQGELHPTMNTGNAASALSGRVAYLLDLCGPCETVDTACSSSLVALHRACQSLRSGECSAAFAGGVNLLLDMDNWKCLDLAGMMAPDGRCKVFDASADGYVRGEGGGAVILQRLSAARRDGHRILGVIRASAVNQDGASNGFTAPSGTAQEQLLDRVLTKADLQPKEIDYIECHGTGTSLGDPIEVNAIQAVYGQDNREHPLVLGAVKSQIGHLEAAAGIAGFIKSLLVLAHRHVPANLHFTTPNPLLELSGLSIASEAQSWPDKQQPVRAAVSSFGFTGSNCHIIVESEIKTPDIVESILPYPDFQRQSCWIDNTKVTSVPDGEDRCAAVCAIIENNLRLEAGAIDPNESLFNYGVDSLIIIEVLLKLETRFGRRLKLEELYDGIDTVADIAAWIDRAEPLKEESKGETATASDRPSVLPIVMPDDGSSLNAQQQVFFDKFALDYAARTSESKKRSSADRPVLADQRAVSGFRKWKKEIVYPIYANSANGSKIEDVDGNQYIDIAMEFGVNLFGHNPTVINDAVRSYMESPLPLAVQNPMTGEVAEAISEMTGFERVCFLCTGSEAVMAALRVARIATGRQRVAMFRWSYHGAHDQVLAHPGSDGSEALVPGVNPGALSDVLLLDYGSPESLEILKKEAGSLAAILVEPVQSRHPDLQPGDFLKALRRISQESDSVLIFDEVITGFRCHAGGANSYFDVDADLAVYGKIIGGGYPLAALAGKARLMNHIDGGPWQHGDDSSPQTSQTFVGGTYNGHPVAMAAAMAVMKHLKQEGPQLQAELNVRTEQFAKRLNAFFAAELLPLKIEQFSSLFRFVCTSHDTDLFYAALRFHGIYATEVRNCFLSTAHTDADIVAIEQAVKSSANLLRQGGFLAPTQQTKTIDKPDSVTVPQGRKDRCVTRLGGAQDPELRLFCLPYAGGGSRPYREWPDALPKGVETLYLQLPGREARMGEPLIEDFDTLLDELCSSMEGWMDRPWALFGHSMGATIAFEMARRLGPKGNLAGLFVSGENAPGLPLPRIDPGELTDAELVAQAQALGAELSPAHAQHFLPRLRADLSVCATHNYVPEPLLECPLIVLGSDGDPLVPLSTLDQWRPLTTGECVTHPLEGGHFFLESDSSNVRAIIRHELEERFASIV